MHYTVAELQRLPENILSKYTLIHYELNHDAEKPEAAIALIAGLSESAINNYKSGQGCLTRKAWKLIYEKTQFELIREWDKANRII